MSNTKKIGTWGEAYALKYLENCGFYLYQSNYRQGRNEIDLIVYKKELLVFVEVKTRGTVNHGYPESFLLEQQKANIHDVATYFLQRHPWSGTIRFDIVSIWNTVPLQLEHFVDAF